MVHEFPGLWRCRPEVGNSWTVAWGRANITVSAGVAELVDARDLKSWVPNGACGFDSRPRHHYRACIYPLTSVKVARAEAACRPSCSPLPAAPVRMPRWSIAGCVATIALLVWPLATRRQLFFPPKPEGEE